jgi:hypothetical protein
MIFVVGSQEIVSCGQHRTISVRQCGAKCHAAEQLPWDYRAIGECRGQLQEKLSSWLAFQLVGNADQLVSTPTDTKAPSFLPVEVIRSSAKGSGEPTAMNADVAPIPIRIVWMTVAFFAQTT